MKYFIELLDGNFNVKRVHKTTYSSLRGAMARIYDLQLKGNVRVKRQDGHIYDIIVYPTGVVAESEYGQRFTY